MPLWAMLQACLPGQALACRAWVVALALLQVELVAKEAPLVPQVSVLPWERVFARPQVAVAVPLVLAAASVLLPQAPV